MKLSKEHFKEAKRKKKKKKKTNLICPCFFSLHYLLVIIKILFRKNKTQTRVPFFCTPFPPVKLAIKKKKKKTKMFWEIYE